MSASAGSRFEELHDHFFVLPNPWDVGSAVILEELGFEALATTSSGLAMSFGRQDGEVTLDELVTHVAQLAEAVAVPINVDAERCFADDPDGVAETVNRLALAGAGGASIEDWNPETGAIDPIDVATERVAAATAAARPHGLVITARCENHIRGVTNLDDTIRRLEAYRDAGAGALYAPGISTESEIEAVVGIGAPVNVLGKAGVPGPKDLERLGVIRMSTGGALARLAYSTMRDAALELVGAS